MKGAGQDGKFGTKDDAVTAGSSVGALGADAFSSVFVESGSIGATTSQGEMIGVTYIATDSSATAAGIGAISVGNFSPSLVVHPLSELPPVNNTSVTGALVNSTFISNAGIGDIQVNIGGLATDNEAAISGSTFLAGHAIGNVSVTNGVDNEGGLSYGILNSTFKAGINGSGGIKSITVNSTQEFSEAGEVTNYGIESSTFDASVASGHSADIGAINVTVSLSTDGNTVYGIDASTFRTHGNIGDITSTLTDDRAAAVQASTFSAFGSIGNINITGSVDTASIPRAISWPGTTLAPI